MATQPVTIGVDIGGTNLRAAVIDRQGTMVDTEQLPTPSSVGALEKALTMVVDTLRQRHPQITAVGLAVAGFITSDQTTVRFAPHLPWRNAEITTRLSKLWDIPVVLEHDANSAAWGEYILGAAQNTRNTVLFALGTGIGGAVIIDGKIYRGAYGVAPEFGHLTVVPGGRACPCGKRGCLERYCSGSALPLTAQDYIALGAHPESKFSQEFANKPEEITGRVVVRMAREGDPLALAVLKDMATWLGKGLSLVQDVFDPELIVLSGGVARDADLLIDRAEAVLHHSVVGAGHRPISRVVSGELGSEAGMIGVAMLAHERANSDVEDK
ncbi:ROK family protein [Corynebacterium anserum]|uniref:ROK family protein n=1 Tax=Corynebacterium anserum TaxID=2684406 RepID=A0A7G7YMW6_9CORY|nr:ROK family protein [Corynebacterium anserum]MBC2680935.1 ROK family protein [Corynebacterium anserum]QNH95836.1 ROK family protein [Corynebacterium anserum]